MRKLLFYSMCLTSVLLFGHRGNAQCTSGTTDPTGSFYNGLPDTYLAGNQIVNTCSGNLQSLSFYSLSPTPAGQLRFAIYSDNGNAPFQLLAQTVIGNLLSGWNTLAIQGNYPITPGTYWVMVVSSSTSGNGMAELTGANILFNAPVNINALPAIISSTNPNLNHHFVSYMTVGGISYSGSPFCQTGVGFVTRVAGTPGGGTFSAPAGLNINSTTGVIYLGSSTPATYTVTYTYAGGSATTDVTVIPLPKIAVGPIASVCQSDVSFKLPYTFTGSPVSYSIRADTTAPITGFTSVVDTALPVTDTIAVSIPAGSPGGIYKFIISVKNAQGCVSPGTVVARLIVASPATTSITYPTPLCQTGEILPTRTGAPGGVYSSTTGLYMNPANGLITPAFSTPGNYTVNYTLTSASGCSFSVSTNLDITPLPKVSLGTVSSLCVGLTGSTASLPYTVANGTPVSYDMTVGTVNPMPNFTPVTGVTLDPNTISVDIPVGTAAGTYSFNLYVRSAGGCVSPKNVFRVKVSGPCPVASPAYSRTINPVKNVMTEESTITIAPNPVRRILNIHTATQNNMSVRISSSEGRMIVTKARFNAFYNFDMNGYAPGIYIVEVVNEKTGEVVRKKIVKE